MWARPGMETRKTIAIFSICQRPTSPGILDFCFTFDPIFGFLLYFFWISLKKSAHLLQRQSDLEADSTSPAIPLSHPFWYVQHSHWLEMLQSHQLKVSSKEMSSSFKFRTTCMFTDESLSLAKRSVTNLRSSLRCCLRSICFCSFSLISFMQCHSGHSNTISLFAVWISHTCPSVRYC